MKLEELRYLAQQVVGDRNVGRCGCSLGEPECALCVLALYLRGPTHILDPGTPDARGVYRDGHGRIIPLIEAARQAGKR